MKHFLSIVMVLILFGCGGGETGPSYTSYAGTWGYDDADTKIRVYLSIDPNFSDVPGYHSVYSPYIGRAEIVLLSDVGSIYSGDTSLPKGNDAGGLDGVSPLTMYIPVYFTTSSLESFGTLRPTTQGATNYSSLTYTDVAVTGKTYVLTRR